MDVRLDTLLEPGLKLWYEVGSNAPLAIRVLVERKGIATGEKDQLVARND
jgi:hypothetical protein